MKEGKIQKNRKRSIAPEYTRTNIMNNNNNAIPDQFFFPKIRISIAKTQIRRADPKTRAATAATPAETIDGEKAPDPDVGLGAGDSD